MPAMTVITVKIANWILTHLLWLISGPLIPAIGRHQRIARGVRAGHYADGAAPLHLQLGQVAFPAGAGEKPSVEAAQGQIDDRGEVGVVAANPVLDRLLRPRIGAQKA